MKTTAWAFALIFAAAFNASAASSPSVEGAYLYIASPAHGEVVSSPL